MRVSFPVPRGIRKSDVTLALADNSLRLTLRDFPQPLLDGPLWGRVNTQKARQRGHKLTKSGRVAVTLEKLDRVPWKQLFKEGVSPVAANYAALTPPPPQKKLMVVYDYDSEAPNELTIRENDIVTVITEDPSGWWKGELNGTVGLFPSNFAQPYEDGPDQLDDDSDEEEAPALSAMPVGAVPMPGLPSTPTGAPSNELMAKLQRRTAAINGPTGGGPAPGPAGPGAPAPREPPASGAPNAPGPFAGRGGPGTRPRDIARQSTPVHAGLGGGGPGAPPVAARAQSTMFGGPEERPRGGGVAAAAAALAGAGGGGFGGAPPPGGVSPFGGGLRATAPPATSAAPAPAGGGTPPPAGGDASRRPPPPARAARPMLSVSEPVPELVVSSPFGGKLRRAAPAAQGQESIPAPTPELEASTDAYAPPGTVALAKALHDYQATADEELSFGEGDTIYVLVKDESGWWQGTANDQTGWFPANFVEELPFNPGSSDSSSGASSPMSSSGDGLGADDASVADKLADIESASARLATPKRALGASNRRRPSRSKRVIPTATTGAPSVVASVLASTPVPAASPAPAASAPGPAHAPAASFRSNLRKAAPTDQNSEPAEVPVPAPVPVPVPVPAAVEVEKEESKPTAATAAQLKKSPTAVLARAPEGGLGSLPSRQATSPLLTRSPAPAPAAAASSPLSTSQSSLSTEAGQVVAPAKWPTQQLGEYREFCADVWAMLESAGGLALALCATDGTTFARGGASQQPFALGQCAFPFLQALAISQSGARAISAQVGSERAPAGDVLSLNAEKKPHNGLTSAGALKLSSLLFAGQDAPSRIGQLLQSFAAFAGTPYLSCSMPAYLSLRSTSNKDYALAYWLKSCGGLDSEVVPTLEFFFQACAIEASCETLAVMAATLANSGACPSSLKQAAKSDAADEVANQLASCCGLSEFNETPDRPIALKASTTSGCAFIVVPGVMGLAVFAPPASPALGKFCKLLSSKYPSLHSAKP